MSSLNPTITYPINVAAAIVFYEPDLDAFNNAIELSQSLPIVVVDNSESSVLSKQLPLSERLSVITNNKNFGVSTAFNQGIRYWQEKGFQWCFLFDQDSKLESDFIHNMLSPITRGEQESHIAAYVPYYYAENLASYGKIIQVNKFRIKRLEPKEREDFVWASYAINSGSLINLTNFERIGPFHDGLFIDFSDIEWGLRANNNGFSILTNPQATLIQQLGEIPISILGKKIVNHSPIRHYYYIRNVIHMLRFNHVPIVWKLLEVVKLPVRLILYSTLTTNKTAHIKAMATGFIDGLQKRQGKYGESTRNR
ncbi:putative dTDP-rhamnosyl transferase rfbF [Vibrio coralliirubri]|uniref:glycosyltransferase family 2 protein n=1 Tax=Vibrio coralliirubri TaxID=1516159 RepID=UPI00063A6CAC|nr:glycosyltransferase family 2 protein [Vibrio coralliirubri]CDT39169.1 putative dTDP-rhamnosyl transferase rfbF [Vibrio coralliirubri]